MAIDARYSFLVELIGASGTVTVGGFSECSGLADGATTGARSAALKRGLVNSQAMTLVRSAGARPTLLVTLRDERGAPLKRWRLSGATITKYSGPALSATGTDVAVEELSLTAESITAG